MTVCEFVNVVIQGERCLVRRGSNTGNRRDLVSGGGVCVSYPSFRTRCPTLLAHLVLDLARDLTRGGIRDRKRISAVDGEGDGRQFRHSARLHLPLGDFVNFRLKVI